MNRGLLSLLLTICVGAASAQDLALDDRFVFHGVLRDGGVVVDGFADLRLTLFDQPVGGSPVGTTETLSNVEVTDGVFSVAVPFSDPSAFSGARRHLEVEARHPTGAGAFTTLTPRVELVPTPHSRFARTAAHADDASSIGGEWVTVVVPQGGAATVTPGMFGPGSIADGDFAFATLHHNKLSTDIVRSVDGVVNDGGDVDLVAGPGIALAPDDGADSVTITASGADADTVGGLDSAQLLRSSAVDSFAGNTLTVAPASTLLVHGSLETSGPIHVGSGTAITVNGSSADLTIGGIKMDLRLGDSAADTTATSGALEAGAAVTTDAVHFRTGGGLGVEGGGESFSWHVGEDRFRGDHDLHVDGLIENVSGTPPYYNGFTTVFLYPFPFPTQNDLITGNLAASEILCDFPVVIFSVGVGGATVSPHEFGSNQGTEVIDAVRLTTDPTDGDTQISFKDGGSDDANYIRWDDAYTDHSSCSGQLLDGFVWHIEDDVKTGWVFGNAQSPLFDAEFHVNDMGDVDADGAFLSAGACDLAETFLGDAALRPGTLVRADLATPEGVEPTTRSYDPTLVGVVSTRPGLLLDGPTADAYPMRERLAALRTARATAPDDGELARAARDLERALDDWTRGDVAVALKGRVPVRVVGPVRAGDALTSSDVAGHAMALCRPGPAVGIALETKTDTGPGEVLVLLQPGWREPAADRPESPAGTPSPIARGEPTVRMDRQVWGDVDRDGRDDVVVVRPGEGARLHRNLGGGRFEDVTDRVLSDGAAVRSARLEDVDGDGTLDLTLVGAAGRRVLSGNGAFGFVDVTHHVDPSTEPDDHGSRLDAIERRLADLRALLHAVETNR